MLSNRFGAVLKDVQVLYDSGTVGGLTDADLLGWFVDGRDETAERAFAALVERHGPMVLRVCRSVLHDDHDAQDAFQATFLILVRRASDVRKRGSVGSWLYGAALRVSARARSDMARRRRHEARAAGMARDRTTEKPNPLDLSAVLQEELARLPERYRAAVVICYLEGQTCEAAARQLGWPIGTVKSRLARGRRRLVGQLIRRGHGEGSDGASTTVPILPPALASNTVQAMLQFAAGRSTAGLASSAALSWTFRTLRSMQMIRISVISLAVIVSLAAGALLATQARERAKTSVPARTTSQARELDASSPSANKVEMVTVQVVDTSGHAVPNVEVEVFDMATDREGPRNRTGTDGRVRLAIDAHNVTRFLARPDDQRLGWASWPGSEARKAQAGTTIPLVLIARTHQVEGSVLDAARKPIPGVQVRAWQVQHDINRGAYDPGSPQQISVFGSAVTDEGGRYILSLPEKTNADLAAFHPLYVGPSIACGADARTIAPVTLEAAGGIAGTLVDAVTEKPVEGAVLRANRIEIDLHDIRGKPVGGGRAVSDARGQFRIDGVTPGVYNLCLSSSPRGERFTAQAVEGVRVKAGEVASADLKLVAGRRAHGTVFDVRTGMPMGGVAVMCSSSALPSAGNAGKSGYTDDQGRFEFFVPAGLACVYLAGSSPFADRGVDTRTLIVAADRDPEPVRLRGSREPNDPLLEEMRAFSPNLPAEVKVLSHAGNDPPQVGTRTVVGRIFDQDGAPIPGVQVIYDDRKSAITVTNATDRLGVFRLTDVPPGQLMIGFDKKGYKGATVTIGPEVREIKATLPSKPIPPD